MNVNEREHNTTHLTEHLESLIRIPSSSGQENEITEWIEKYIVSLGFRSKMIPTGDGRFSLYADLTGYQPGPSLLLAGHIDTVNPAQGWETDPFTPIRKCERIYGLGSCDMKAGLAVMLTVAQIAATHRDRLSGKLALGFLPDEEAYSVGARAFIADGVSADFCLMPEPHFHDAVTGGPGKMLLKVNAIGKAAHGARPWEGINAVSELSRFISSFDQIKTQAYRDLPPQPYVPLSVKGGPERYSLSVPDTCSAVISKQLLPGETREIVLNTLAQEIKNGDYNAEITIEVIPPYYAPYVSNTGTRPFSLFQQCCHRHLGANVPFCFGTSVSDANCLAAEAGIPTLMFGPQGGNMHQANEWVYLPSVEKCLDVYRDFLFSYIFLNESHT